MWAQKKMTPNAMKSDRRRLPIAKRTSWITPTIWWLIWTSLQSSASWTTLGSIVMVGSGNSGSSLHNFNASQNKSNFVTSGRRWDSNETEPKINTVITAQSGDTAFLPCHVALREDHGVSWVRRRDWYILSADSKVYSRDERIRVTSVDNTENIWTLLIKYIRKDDEGIYDCQITTRKSAWTQSVELRIVEPQAVLVGSEDIYVGVGSPFTVTCVITNTLKPPEYVSWNFDSKSLNFGSHEQLQQPSNLQKKWNRAGHTITFDPGPPSVSRLLVNSANTSDSGRYTCQPSSGLSASTNVHVALGNEMAAIQATDSASKNGHFLLVLLTVSVLFPLCFGLML
ncbi:zwei Ig domain protein zig-8-like isoform X1 [Daphnia carinata]|uniref:zwei Ig domain protein zig-8-like isoform X1 n=1 Tax=Daphnia carinata TaxID=120202 RepID=UPI00257AFA70|nr:zwei Ig domain protein zig-8-like isoform X1 [Daphnia carinata]